MKCPKCKSLIEYSDIEIIRPKDQRFEFFDVEIRCPNEDCEAEFFYRIHEKDLILCD